MPGDSAVLVRVAAMAHTSLDDVVCLEEGRGNREPEGLSGLEVDELEFRRLLHGQISRLGAFQDAIDVVSSSAARSGNRSSLPSEYRRSMTMFWFSIQPCSRQPHSRRPCMTAAQLCAGRPTAESSGLPKGERMGERRGRGPLPTTSARGQDLPQCRDVGTDLHPQPQSHLPGAVFGEGGDDQLAVH
jgi:hypothetical protein